MELEIIKQNVSGLTDEQYDKLVTLTTNNEEAIKTKAVNDTTGQIHQQYDNDLKELGYAKPDGKKSYEHVKETISNLKNLADKSSSLTTELERMKEEVKKGGSEEMKRLLAERDTQLKDIADNLSAERKAHDDAKKDFEQQLLNIKIQSSLSNALNAIKIKDGTPESIANLAKNAAVNALMEKNIEFDTYGNIIFKDDKGEILRNNKNGAKPYTAAELLVENDALKDIIDNKKLNGTGLKPTPTPNNSPLDISDCKNQIEADEKIEQHLLSIGITRFSEVYQTKFTKLREDAGVAKLKLN